MMLYLLARDHWEKDLKDRRKAARLRTSNNTNGNDVRTETQQQQHRDGNTMGSNDDDDNVDHGNDGQCHGSSGNHDNNKSRDSSEEEVASDHHAHIHRSETMIINHKEDKAKQNHYIYGGGVLKPRATIDIEVEVIGRSCHGDASEDCDIDDDGDVDDGDMKSTKQPLFNRSKKRKISSRGMINVVPKSRRKLLENKNKGMDDGEDTGDSNVDYDGDHGSDDHIW